MRSEKENILDSLLPNVLLLARKFRTAFIVSSISSGNSGSGQGSCTGGAEVGGGGGDGDACAGGGSTDIREGPIDEDGSCSVDEVVGRGRSLQWCSLLIKRADEPEFEDLAEAGFSEPVAEAAMERIRALGTAAV